MPGSPDRRTGRSPVSGTGGQWVGKDKIAQAIENRGLFMDLEPLGHMGMVAYHQVCPGVCQALECLGHIRRGERHILDAAMGNDDHQVNLVSQALDPCLHQGRIPSHDPGVWAVAAVRSSPSLKLRMPIFSPVSPGSGGGGPWPGSVRPRSTGFCCMTGFPGCAQIL